MAIRDWHFGKIALIWIVTLGAWPVYYELFYSEDALIFWVITAAITATITWRWLSGREGRAEGTVGNTTSHPQKRTSELEVGRGMEASSASPTGRPTDDHTGSPFGDVLSALMSEYGIAVEEIQRKYVSYALALQAPGSVSNWNDDVDDHARAIGALTESEMAAARTDFHQAVINRIIIALVTAGCRRLDLDNEGREDNFSQARIEQVNVDAYPLPPEILNAALHAWTQAAGRGFKSQEELEDAQDSLFGKWILIRRGLECDNFNEESAEDLEEQAGWQLSPMEEDVKRGWIAGVLELQRLALARRLGGAGGRE